MGHLYGYARWSKILQDPAVQAEALEAAGCARIFTEKASGTTDRRPQLDRLMRTVVPGDVVVVWRLDRLGRSLRGLLGVLNELAERQVGFQSLTEGFDTTTTSGRLLFDITRSLATSERDLTLERTLAGIATASARAGGPRGRPRTVMTPEMLQTARQMHATRQYTLAAIAETIGVSRTTVDQHLKRSSVDGNPDT